MITILQVEGARRSLFVCDACDQPIFNANLAVALCLSSRPAMHAHKGACHTAIERAHKTRLGGWMELTEHVSQLFHNSQVMCEHGS